MTDLKRYTIDVLGHDHGDYEIVPRGIPAGEWCKAEDALAFIAELRAENARLSLAQEADATAAAYHANEHKELAEEVEWLEAEAIHLRAEYDRVCADNLGLYAKKLALYAQLRQLQQEPYVWVEVDCW